MKKKRYLTIAYCIILLGGLFALFLGVFLGEKSSSGYEENYVNQQDATPMDRLDSYLSAKIGGRQQLLSSYNKITAGLFQSSQVEDVIVGKDGYLFFDDTLGDFTGSALMSEEEMELLANAFTRKAEELSKQGIRLILLVAPNKSSVCADYMPERYGEKAAESNAERLFSKLKELGMEEAGISEGDLEAEKAENKSGTMCYVNLFGVLTPEDYFHTDSHWNANGAAIAFEAATGRELDLARYEESLSLTGDLQRMLYPDAKANEYELELKDPTYEYLTKTRSVEQAYIESYCANGSGSLVMYRDSFANNLIPYFSDAYEYCIYDKKVPYDWSDLETYGADTVVIEIAERNLPLLADYLEN